MKFFALLYLSLASVLLSQNFDSHVVMETVGNGSAKVVSGNASLAKQSAPPASTFKILLAWAGIEEGIVTPETKYLCSDKHVPNTPRELTLQEALYYSSNDYFIWFGGRLGADKIESYIRKSQFAEIPPTGWIDPGLVKIQGGGKLVVTPEQQHRFISKVARGELSSSPKIQSLLEQALSWPSSDPETKLYGKTGTHSGAVWFNGFGKTKDTLKLVTVYIPYEAPHGTAARQKAIGLFYSRFGQKPPIQ